MDEDYSDYSGEEEFHEDSLSNEEYDALYAALPKVKEALLSYNSDIPDLDIKEALYYHYFEVEPACEELRSKFPKKKGMYLFLLFDPANSKLIEDFVPITPLGCHIISVSTQDLFTHFSQHSL